MSELTPITRIESYLDAIVNSGTPPTEDITRIETFLQAIYDNTVCQLTPITRIEMFLGKISGQDIVLPEPITRIELYLAVIAGEDVELPENPITRLEMYLAEWADSGDWTTISGAIVEFITQRAHKLKSCAVTLEPQQDLSHGDPSPTNICPISGWTGVTVTRDGKNFVDDTIFYYSGVSRRTSGTGANELRTFINSLPSGTYTVAFDSVVDAVGDSTKNWEFGFYGTSTFGTINSIINKVNPAVGSVYRPSATINKPDGGVINTLYLYAASSSANDLATISKFQLELGSTATAFEPYQGEEVSVTWEDEAGTVYGGTVDLVSGELVVDKKTVTLNGSESTWANVGGGYPQAFRLTSQIFSDVKEVTVGTQNLLTNKYPFMAHESGDLGIRFANLSSSILYVYDVSFSNDLSGFLASLSTAPLQVCYELSAPITIQLPPQVVETLEGDNNIWSNAGDVTVVAYGTPIVEPDVQPLQAMNLLLGGAYRNNHTPDDVSDEEALNIITGGADR